MCAFGAVRHFGQNTGEEKIAKKNWDFSRRQHTKNAKTPARRRLQKNLAKHRRGGDCKKKLGLQSETVTVSWHPHSQSGKHKGTSISYLVSRGHPTHILYPERQPDLSHIGLDSKLYLAAPTQPRMSRCGRARTFKASFRVRTGSNPSSSCKRVL